MASILFLGYSNLVKGRILPVLGRSGFTDVAIAKYQDQPWDDAYKACGLPVSRYDSYEEGLASFSGDVVYVSTVNSAHAAYSRKSLEAGFHTIVDKPATMDLAEAEELVALARRKHLFFGEATVYLNHPQRALIRRIFEEKGDSPKLLTVHFTMPPFRPDNFRYSRTLGGGAIMDTAPYAVSIARYFFREEPRRVFCVVNERQADGLDIEYSLLMEFPGGRSLAGHFGFNTEYVNQVFLLGERTNVTVNRIFTIPDTLENAITVTRMNETEVVRAPSGNSFVCYLRKTLEAIGSGGFEEAYGSLLSDARVRQMIIDSI